MLVVGQKREIDLPNLLSYELSPVPPALCHLDGSLRKTNKSTLLHELEMENSLLPPVDNPQVKTSCIIDLLAIIQTTPKGTKKTFGEFSDAILNTLMTKLRNASEVHVVPDRYDNEESIKAEECRRSGSSKPIEVVIHGRETKLPSDLKRFLSSGTNKTRLVKFMCDDWIKLIPSKLESHQKVILGLQDGTCLEIGRRGVNEVSDLECDHEEADTRMLLHCKQSKVNGCDRVVVCSPDTDVAVLCCHHFHNIGIKEMYFLTGTGTKRRYISIHQTVSQSGKNIREVLPAIHALTGCDSTSCLANIGKKKAITTIKNNFDDLNELRSLGSDASVIDQNVLMTARLFISKLFGCACSDLNKVRYYLFTKKNFDSTKLPPTNGCGDVHIQMANYQTYIWTHATQPFLYVPSPVNNGWDKDDEAFLYPSFLNLDADPSSVVELTTCGYQVRCLGRCRCKKVGLPCTEACKCNGDCENAEEDDTDSEYDSETGSIVGENP